MNPLAVTFLLVNAIALMTLPRRWALLPLLMGACYMTNAQSIDVGPFHFTVLRVLLLLGIIRSKTRKEQLAGGLIGMDRVMLIWAAWFLCSSIFHKPFGEALVTRLGVCYNAMGIYFLIRTFCGGPEDLIQIIKIIAIILAPVALEMANEKLTSRDMFGYFGGVPVEILIRDDKLRAQGPFGHPILAGTVGGLCVPLMLGIWSQHRRVATIGLIACIIMILASASSGPIMTAVFSIAAMILWRWRWIIRYMKIGAVIIYILCNIVMTRPAYYLLEKIDLTGSSAGYHRAAIIEAGIGHLGEWWLGGSDFTRHWMPYGVSFSPNHVDITNHYLFYGVDGGFPLMFIFMCAVWLGFRYVAQTLQLRANAPIEEQYLIWSTGALLFGHACTMVSVAYFDQSVMFLYLSLAVIASIYAKSVNAARQGEDFSETMDAPPAIPAA